MKKAFTLFTLLILIAGFSNVQAQTYKLNKQNYDYKMYIPQAGDPYNPNVMGVVSFIAPGLGQILCGETGRGLAFVGGYFVVGSITALGALTGFGEESEGNGVKLNAPGISIFVIGLSSWIALNIWSSKDAAKVAKVNNMYYQDLRGELSSVKVELNPFVNTRNYLGQAQTVAGLSLKVTF